MKGFSMKKRRKIFLYTLSGIAIFMYVIFTLSNQFGNSKYFLPIKRFFFAPKVSVVMSTYNRASVLPIAIESILNQTYTDFEFIIINDGSKDNTDEVIKYYAEEDARIIHLTNETNQGLIYSLNRGLDLAKGKYIARMDDDDKSVAFRLERQVKAMDMHPDIVVMGSGIIGRDTIPHKNKEEPVIEDADKVELNTYFSSGLAHPTIIIRRDFLEQHHVRYNPEYLYAEDCGLYKDILNFGGKISTMKEGLLHFHYTSGLSHPKDYGHIQGETFKKIQKEKLTPFFDVPYEMLGAFKSIENKCEILKKMVVTNKTKQILNQSVLENMEIEVCSKAVEMKKAIMVEHPYWEDYIFVNPDSSFFRLNVRTETGKIQKNKDQTVTLRWKNWKPEVFRIKNGKHYVYLRDESGEVKKPRTSQK